MFHTLNILFFACWFFTVRLSFLLCVKDIFFWEFQFNTLLLKTAAFVTIATTIAYHLLTNIILFFHQWY